MRVLITGGAGFIGSHLADLFIRERHQVSVIDNLSTGSIENIRHLLSNSRFTFLKNSIFNEELLHSLILDSDIVFHLAASVGVKLIVAAPVASIQTNVAGTDLLLRLAAGCHRRVVLASTSEVYGKSTQLPFREDGDLVLGATSQRRWSYACSKAIDEFLALAWYYQNQLPVTIVRLFNTVGPRQTGRYGMVLPTFVRQALQGAPITVYGSGEQTRCFTHVADVVKALAAVPQHDATIGEIYNLGGTEETSINRLAAMVIAATGSASPVVHIPYDEAYAPGFEDMPRRLPSVAKAQAAFGFRAECSLEDVLTDVIADQRERLCLPQPCPLSPEQVVFDSSQS